MEKENKVESKIEKAESKLFHKFKKNPWMITASVLGILLIASLFFAVKGVSVGKVISGENAGEKLVGYLNEQTGGGVTFVSSTDKGNIYEITVSYKGEQIPVYTTKDGKYFVQGAVAIDDKTETTPTEETATEVPKSDKPKFDLYVFSYCPYGTQFEKALVPVYKLLSKKADINLVAIGAMHGEYEHQESLREICIQKVYGKDVLFNYLEKFLGETKIGNCNGDTTCSDPLVNQIMKDVRIDTTTIDICMEKDAEALYQAQNEQAAELGISGSPSVTINGVQTSVGRSADAVLKAICAAFTTAPAECSQTVSTTSETAGFGYGSGSAASSSSASC